MKTKFSKILGIGLTIALLTSLLMIAAPVSAIGQPTVSITPKTISSNAVYTITFDVVKALAVGDEIVVTFPTGTNIAGILAPAGDGDVTIGCSSGIGVGASIATNAASVVLLQKLTITVPAMTTTGVGIGAGATIQLVIGAVNPIVNPATIADTYTVTVGTQTNVPVAIEAAVTSAAYATTAPTVATLPGVVSYYNSAGVLMGSFTGATAIQQAVTLCPTLGKIDVGPGLYTETNITTAAAGVVIKATGTAAETIVKGNFVINHASITIDGFTITPVGTNTTIGTTGNKVTIQNCVFTKRGTATTTVAETLLAYGNTTASGTGTITANTFDTSLGATTDNAILVPQLGLTISNNTFTVDGATGAGDSAINVTNAAGTTTISGNTITGASGIGVTVNGAGTTAVTGNAFSNLNSAFNITTGTVTVDGNTIDVCGLVKTTVPVFAGQAAIVVTSTAGLTIKNNTITNSPNEIIQVAANSNLVNMMFNSLTGNTLGVDNNEAAALTLNATHNWWGVDTGPAAGMNTPFSATQGLINATAHLGGEATGTFTNTVGATSLLTKTTVGVDVSVNAALTVGDIIGVANYSANPQDATTLPALDGGFYDVNVVEDGAALPITSVLVKFYNSNITANTVLRVWGTLAGGWVPVVAVSGVNLYEGYAYATITATTTPSIAGLAGTPFALVESPLATLAAPTLAAPTLGATDASLSPAFSWGAVAGATGYEFQLADNANFVLPLVNLTGGEAALIVPFYKYVSELDNATTYYWRVRALDVEYVKFVVSNTSAWVTSVFTTEEEPVEEEEEAPVWTCPQCGLTFATRDALEAHAATAHPPVEPPVIEPIVEVITPAETPITPAWIYAIIGVGAVLVIAVIVLIVRTRRVA